MKYTNKLAKELGEKYGLSSVTLYRWRMTDTIPDMYNNNGERLVQGMTLREAKNYTKLSISQIKALLYLESGDKKLIFNTVSISYWLSGKRNPRKEWIWNIMDRKITERKNLLGL